MEDYLEIGVVANTHGVKGEVKVFPYTFDRKRFELLDEVTMLQGTDEKKYIIERIKYLKQFVIIKFEGIHDMSQAEKLKQSILVIPKKLALPLGDDEYYIGDLIGCAVTHVDGATLGKITDVLATGANDVYVIKNEAGKEILIPAVKQFIGKIDINNKSVAVTYAEGL